MKNGTEILKAMAQETRLRILELLRGGERCVCEIYPAIGEEQSNVSRHLNLMEKAGVLSRRKDGLKIIYGIKYPEVLHILELAGEILQQELQGRLRLLKRR
jgi:DNA-binding transcriptional ArsR family regulator